MEAGLKTDMRTGRPLEAIDKERREVKAAAEKVKMEAAASRLGITQSADGVILQQMVETVAIERIEKLIQADPEMQAYVSILKRMGATENLARRAYERLHGRHMPTVG